MKCKKCGKEILTQDDIVLDEENGILCRECADASPFGRCRECGRVLTSRRIFCDDCYGCYLKPLNGYSKKPYPRFINTKYKDGVELSRRYYGLEMEFSNTNEFALYKANEELYSKGIVYNKSDSSLTSGVEVVTQPMDRRAIRRYVTNEFKSIFNLVGKDYKENAGLHIHVSKKSLSSITTIKLSKLFNDVENGSQDDKDTIAYICRRKKSISSVYSDVYCTVGLENLNWRKKSLLHIDERHVALNLQPKQTIEFRMFKASNDPKEIISYLDFVDSAIEYATNFGLTDMKISRFIKWLNKNTKNKIIKYRTKKALDTYYKNEKQFEKISVGFTKARELLKQLPKISYYKVLSTCGFSVDKKEIEKNIEKIVKGEPITMKSIDFSINNIFMKDIYDEYLRELKRILKDKEARVCA